MQDLIRMIKYELDANLIIDEVYKTFQITSTGGSAFKAGKAIGEG
ncbi:MAG: hypothetical protein PHQ11_06145 [Paludibacter sp.]|nr:hypothetical protein [Paludibacter sp.]